jgi:hypothetical protein
VEFFSHNHLHFSVAGSQRRCSSNTDRTTKTLWTALFTLTSRLQMTNSPGGTAQSFWDNNDDVLLGRVLKSDILSRGRWEFWRGAQPGNDAWTSDESAAVSVMHWPLMIGMNQVNYHQPSGRYLTANYGFIDHNGQPRP